MPKGIYNRNGWKGNQTSFKNGYVPASKGRRKYNISCLSCKKEVRTSDKRKKYCSHHCSTKYRWKSGELKQRKRVEPWNKGIKGLHLSPKSEFKKGMKGILSPAFKHGKTKHLKLLRNSLRWKVWRSKVFERDDYTCQKCDIRGVELHPHHLITVKECSLLDWEEEIFDTDNGLTLCKSCHIKPMMHGGGQNF